MFHDDLIGPSRGERGRAYTVTETRSRFIKKYGTTEVDYTIKINKIMEVKNAINAMIKLAKEKGSYKQGDKMVIVASNPDFNHDISKNVDNAEELMEYVENILSSNEDLDITQCIFHIQITNIPHGKGRVTKIINLANDIKTKICITQIQNNDNLCCPRAIVTGLTYHTNDIFGSKRCQRHQGRPKSTN